MSDYFALAVDMVRKAGERQLAGSELDRLQRANVELASALRSIFDWASEPDKRRPRGRRELMIRNAARVALEMAASVADICDRCGGIDLDGALDDGTQQWICRDCAERCAERCAEL